MNIYTAYRIKKGHDVWDTLTELKLEAMRHVRETLVGVYQDWLEGDMQSIANKCGYDQDLILTEHTKYILCSIYAQKQYHQAIEMNSRQMNLTVSVTVRKLGQRYYLIPECMGVMSKALDFMEKNRKLEEFSYWDSANVPENITPQAWRARRKVWQKLLKQPEEWEYYGDKEKYLTLDVCSAATFEKVDPLGILQKT